MALTTAYVAGLRMSEVAALKVSDIDSRRMVQRIERGKGGKERSAMLSETPLGILREYWRLARTRPSQFPSRPADTPIGRVGDWRAGLGRSLRSLLARSFVCEIAVGTLITERPPHRTGRARLRHPAPTLDV